MDSKEACKYVMPFGKHKGKTLEEIATKDSDGARYLDWAAGLDDLRPETRAALTAFLAIDWVSRMVDVALENDGRQYSEPRENARRPKPWWEK